MDDLKVDVNHAESCCNTPTEPRHKLNWSIQSPTDFLDMLGNRDIVTGPVGPMYKDDRKFGQKIALPVLFFENLDSTLMGQVSVYGWVTPNVPCPFSFQVYVTPLHTKRLLSLVEGEKEKVGIHNLFASTCAVHPIFQKHFASDWLCLN